MFLAFFSLALRIRGVVGILTEVFLGFQRSECTKGQDKGLGWKLMEWQEWQIFTDSILLCFRRRVLFHTLPFRSTEFLYKLHSIPCNTSRVCIFCAEFPNCQPITNVKPPLFCSGPPYANSASRQLTNLSVHLLMTLTFLGWIDIKDEGYKIFRYLTKLNLEFVMP